MAQGEGENARFCLEHARRSLAAPPPVTQRGPEALPRELAAASRRLDALLAQDVNLGYRLARDLFLNGDVEGKAPGAWGDFFGAARDWRADRSLSALERLARAAKTFPWARYYIAEIMLRRLDLFEPAREQIERTRRDCPWLWESLCLRAEILLAQGSAAGLGDLDGLTTKEPAFYAWRGALNLWWGAPKLESLSQAIALGNPDALCWRGGSYALLGRLKEALADLDALLAKDANDPEALTWRAETLRRLGSAEAGAALDRAVEAQHDPLWAAVNRALFRLERKEFDGAMEDAARMAPPVMEDVPDGTGAASMTRWARFNVAAPRLRELLEEALRLARGCRRSDTHLNVMWMRAAGLPVPKRPTPHARLVYWLRARGVTCPPELVFGPGTISEAAARRAISGAKAAGSSRKSRA